MPERPGGRRRGGMAVAALLGVLLAGCGSVPHSGAVHLGRAVPGVGGLGQDDIRVFPAPPRPGMSPRALVRGFLRALVYSDSGYGIARAYLAQGTGWHPRPGITTYAENRLALTRQGSTLTLTAPDVGAVDSDGQYHPKAGTLRRRFTVVRQGGQWRISGLPQDVVLSSFDAGRVLQAATIYYLNQAQTRVVPVQLLVNVEPAGLATTLVRALLDGPDPRLSGALRSAVPAGTSLLGNVPIDDNGVAEVDLPLTLRQLPPAPLARLSAQLSWTLRQLAGVSAVRLLADGAPLAAPGVPSTQPISSWSGFDPDAPPAATGALLVRGHQVAGTGGLAVPAVLRQRGLLAPASSGDGTQVAALRRTGTGTILLTGPAGGPMRPRLRAGSITPPTFDGAGDVLVAESGPAGSRLVMLAAQGGGPVVVRLPATVPAAEIRAVRVSREGSRIAIVVGPPGAGALVVGLLRPEGRSVVVVDPRTVVGGGRDVAGVAWSAADRLVTTVRVSGGHRAVLQTDADGYQRDLLPRRGLAVEPDQVAAAPRQPVVVAGGGRVWRELGSRWLQLSTGTDPAYPD